MDFNKLIIDMMSKHDKQFNKSSELPTQRTRQTPKFKLQNIKPIKLPNDHSREFTLRTNQSFEQYNPLKDKFLRQFFRREQRMKQLTVFSTQASLHHQTDLQRIKKQAEDPSLSSYQNLIPKSALFASNTNTHPYTKRITDQTTLLCSQAQSRPQRLPTEPSSNSPRHSSLRVSKEQFKSFLTKARERLAMRCQPHD